MRRNEQKWIMMWARTAALLAVMLIPAIVIARAGGGEGYSSGGGSGGGGGGGDSDVGFLIYLLFQLIFDYPIIGIPLLIIVIIGVVMAQRQGVSVYQNSVIVRGSPLAHAAQIQPGLDALLSDDPQFNKDQFLQRVCNAFLATQAAWAKQDLTPVRPFLSDGVYERFNIQFAEQKMLGYRNEMANVRVLSADPVEADVDDTYQSISVRISASAEDFPVSLKDGRRIATGTTAPFAEIWIFLRRRGVQSKLNADGLIEGHCPNCGAGIEMNQHARCQQCGSLLRSGQYDWVLTEITQEYEWASVGQPVPGAQVLHQRDPAFSLAALDDTASVVFWRLMAARRDGKSDPIRKMATDHFCDDFLASLGKYGRIFYTQCAVGSVRTMGIYQVDGWDRATIQVMWSGQRYSIGNSGEAKPLGPIGPSRLLLVLGRQADSRTRLESAISSAHCPNCGAPQEETTANSCQSCGTVLNDGRSSWVLLDAQSAASDAGQRILDDFSTGLSADAPALPGIATAAPPGSAGTLAWIVLMAAADGQVAPEEQEMLRTAADKWGIPQQKLDAMIQSALSGQLQPPQPRDADEARGWLAAMVRVSLADGRITGQEYGLLRVAGERCGLAAYDLKTMISRAKVDLYAESRIALRNAKRARA